jgi:hypothetical protein
VTITAVLFVTAAQVAGYGQSKNFPSDAEINLVVSQGRLKSHQNDLSVTNRTANGDCYSNLTHAWLGLRFGLATANCVFHIFFLISSLEWDLRRLGADVRPKSGLDPPSPRNRKHLICIGVPPS